MKTKENKIIKKQNISLSLLKQRKQVKPDIQKPKQLANLLSDISIKKKIMNSNHAEDVKPYLLPIINNKKPDDFMKIYNQLVVHYQSQSQSQVQHDNNETITLDNDKSLFIQIKQLLIRQSDSTMKSLQLDYVDFSKNKDLQKLIAQKQRLYQEETYRRQISSCQNADQLYQHFIIHQNTVNTQNYLRVENIEEINELLRQRQIKVQEIQKYQLDEKLELHLQQIQNSLEQQVNEYNMQCNQNQKEQIELDNEQKQIMQIQQQIENQYYQQQHLVKQQEQRLLYQLNKSFNKYKKHYQKAIQQVDQNKIIIQKLMQTNIKDDLEQYIDSLLLIVIQNLEQFVKESTLTSYNNIYQNLIKQMYNLTFNYLKVALQQIHNNKCNDQIYSLITEQLNQIMIVQLKQYQINIDNYKNEVIISQNITNFDKLSSFDKEVVYTFLYTTLLEQKQINLNCVQKYVNMLLNIVEEQIAIQQSDTSEESQYQDQCESTDNNLNEYKKITENIHQQQLNLSSKEQNQYYATEQKQQDDIEDINKNKTNSNVNEQQQDNEQNEGFDEESLTEDNNELKQVTNKQEEEISSQNAIKKENSSEQQQQKEQNFINDVKEQENDNGGFDDDNQSEKDNDKYQNVQEILKDVQLNNEQVIIENVEPKDNEDEFDSESEKKQIEVEIPVVENINSVLREQQPYDDIITTSKQIQEETDKQVTEQQNIDQQNQQWNEESMDFD